jgi:hypothetical protein
MDWLIRVFGFTQRVRDQQSDGTVRHGELLTGNGGVVMLGSPGAGFRDRPGWAGYPVAVRHGHRPPGAPGARIGGGCRRVRNSDPGGPRSQLHGSMIPRASLVLQRAAIAARQTTAAMPHPCRTGRRHMAPGGRSRSKPRPSDQRIRTRVLCRPQAPSSRPRVRILVGAPARQPEAQVRASPRGGFMSAAAVVQLLYPALPMRPGLTRVRLPGQDRAGIAAGAGPGRRARSARSLSG